MVAMNRVGTGGTTPKAGRARIINTLFLDAM